MTSAASYTYGLLTVYRLAKRHAPAYQHNIPQTMTSFDDDIRAISGECHIFLGVRDHSREQVLKAHTQPVAAASGTSPISDGVELTLVLYRFRQGVTIIVGHLAKWRLQTTHVYHTHTG